jgi:alpha-tubulin suppressor-like RCC1 family protein
LVVVHSGSNPPLGQAQSVSAGTLHTCAVTGDAPTNAACWGQEKIGRLGDGSPSNINDPIDSPVGVLAPGTSDNLGLSADDVITSGTFNSCALLPEDAPANNSIACWGDNSSGQLGNSYMLGSYTSTPAPVVFSDGSKLVNLVKVAAGDTFACALLRTDGSIACWGTNYLGRLGNGRFTDAYSDAPVAVAESGITFVGFTDLSVGADHACALGGSDTVLCWGANQFGQLGTGSVDTDAHSAPVNSNVDGTLFADDFDGD